MVLFMTLWAVTAPYTIFRKTVFVIPKSCVARVSMFRARVLIVAAPKLCGCWQRSISEAVLPLHKPFLSPGKHPFFGPMAVREFRAGFRFPVTASASPEQSKMYLLALAILAVVPAFCQEEPYHQQDFQQTYHQNDAYNPFFKETPSYREEEKLQYSSFEQINHYLLDVERLYNGTVKSFEIGHSVEGRPIRGIRISRNPGVRKPALLLDAGIHAREWVGPVVALYTIQQLLSNASNANLTDGLDWYILPMLNPDGYVYSTEHPPARLWRKNRAKTFVNYCGGVDLNRNFDYVWGGPGSSDDPCSNNYRGPYPFSEPEAVAFGRFVLSIAQDVRMYLTLHSAAQAILYPWGYTNLVPPDWQDLDNLAKKAEAAMSQVNGTRYHVGPTTKIVGLGAGGSDDWAKGAVGIKYVYTLELPGLNHPEKGFHPPTETLPIIARESFEGIKVFADHARNRRP